MNSQARPCRLSVDKVLLSVVLPVYNEAKVLPALLNDAQTVYLPEIHVCVALENLGIAQNAVERGAEFMAHFRQKFTFSPVCRLGSPLSGFSNFFLPFCRPVQGGFLFRF